MKIKISLIVLVTGFICYCGLLVGQSGLFKQASMERQKNCILLQNTVEVEKPTIAPAPKTEKPTNNAGNLPLVGADQGPAKTVVIGAADPCTENPETGYKLQLQLSTKGAAIKTATFSNGDIDGDGKGDGFDNRDKKNQPLQILSPAKSANGQILSLANTDFILDQEILLSLNQLQWQLAELQNDQPDKQRTVFEAIIKNKTTEQPIFKLTKSYEIAAASYDVKCGLTIENLSDNQHKAYFKMHGPLGIEEEGVRSDMRKVISGFYNVEKKYVTSDSLDIKKLEKAKTLADRRLISTTENFLWSSITNKYFTAIIVPMPDAGTEYCNWVTDNIATIYNDNGKVDTIGVELRVMSNTFEPAGAESSKKSYNFDLYVGPKDKGLFDKNPMYDKLGFVHTITFMGCCCPAAMINPLAFGILAAMEWMYGFIGNYGVVIIILVFFIRLAMHPITKKSQISMSKMGKLGPQVEELKKKYANNKAELQKQTMQLYKNQGASPIMGFLPMLIQMPIWIALYSAIYASISLRGAPFLPFWITDLSAPDALFTFKTITLPFLGWEINSFNLLPILMGVAMYLQQKTMPKTPSTNPQAAQQQKMMMIMMPLMFPLFLYKAPSGLNLYIMASTFAGAIEQQIIRKHIKEKEAMEASGMVAATSKTGGKAKKKKPKPFFKTNR